MSDVTTTPETLDLDKLITKFESTLMGEDSPRGELWKAWHFVQVYSTWGLRLPATASSLKTTLKVVNDPSSYSFFPTMLDGHKEIHEACKNFQTNTFPQVISLGQDLKGFAEDNRGGEDSIWEVIIEMVADKESYPDALELIQDLQSRAAENVNKAEAVTRQLNAFSAALESASNGKLKTAKTQIKNDQRTSDAAIATLRGDADVVGSIANVSKLTILMKKEYDHNVVVAATSPTYAWVFPFGTIAAATIAGVYGKRAVEALKKYDELSAKLTTKSNDLNIAIQARSVLGLADSSISNTREQTAIAITQINIVKNAWNDLSGNLKIVADKVKRMTKTTDNEEELKGKGAIKLYARHSRTAWDNLWPTIVALTDKPYIVVEDNDKTVSQIVQDIELSMANPAAAN